MTNVSRRNQHRSADVTGPLGTIVATSPISRSCPNCDAVRGARCVVWMVDKGVRVRIIRNLKGFHVERRAPRRMP